jgi:hypothetical protein
MTEYQLLAVGVVGVVAVALIARFETFCLRDLANTPDARLQVLTRTGWFVAIVVAIPIGGIAYLCSGRRR